VTQASGPGPSAWLRVRSAIIDRMLAAVLLLGLSPIIAVLGRRVRGEDGGPALLALDRVGRGGATFGMWKLRTMRPAASDGPAITASGDQRITAVGAQLRRWRLDELPQAWNVVRGDMALLGPRPETPSMVDAADPRWAAVLAVRPGVAGPTQLLVEAWEAEVLTDAARAEELYEAQILPVKLAIDRWYVERATPALDLVIAWSMVERFLLHRGRTLVHRRVLAEVPAAAAVPAGGAGA
jgi:lipopolysaccharide/colanic/teichoic acid biosynthesis glycosyltransferase